MTTAERLLRRLKKIGEGTWEVPDSIDRAKELYQILQKPVPAKDAVKMIGHLIGDDGLFDAIGNATAEEPHTDVRNRIADTIKKWLGELNKFKHEIDPSVQKVWQQIAALEFEAEGDSRTDDAGRGMGSL